MAYHNTYKKNYTEQEIEEFYAWFEQNMERLPKSLTLDKSMNIPDLHFTVRQMINKLQQQLKTRTDIFSGQFAILLYIKECLLKQEASQENKTNE